MAHLRLLLFLLHQLLAVRAAAMPVLAALQGAVHQSAPLPEKAPVPLRERCVASRPSRLLPWLRWLLLPAPPMWWMLTTATMELTLSLARFQTCALVCVVLCVLLRVASSALFKMLTSTVT